MAATDDTVADDDALYVLTAVLLTPAQYPGVLGDDYVAACSSLALEPYAEGYGLVLGQDGGGARWTVVVDDVSLVAVAIASWDCGMEYDLSPDGRSVVSALPGWPLALAVAAPGVPEPHDPAPGPEGSGPVPLAPPDPECWGPAQRRLGADEVASGWAVWRGRVEEGTVRRADGTSGDQDGDEGGGGTARDVVKTPDGTAPRREEGGGSLRHPGVRRALSEARAYLTDPPPPGRIRSAFASGAARTLRVDGPGWSLVARTDDMAFVLLDEEPGEVLPVGRGPELPGLLRSLDALAARPV
ncbi:hypothetical protein ACIPJM_21600 [Streptomyces halstedii]|uniref:hypothetical protein n=1 Tax=Streptomyces halstedii TaxID=1944 RepID=UPI00381F6E44